MTAFILLYQNIITDLIHCLPIHSNNNLIEVSSVLALLEDGCSVGDIVSMKSPYICLTIRETGFPRAFLRANKKKTKKIYSLVHYTKKMSEVDHHVSNLD